MFGFKRKVRDLQRMQEHINKLEERLRNVDYRTKRINPERHIATTLENMFIELTADEIIERFEELYEHLKLKRTTVPEETKLKRKQ